MNNTRLQMKSTLDENGLLQLFNEGCANAFSIIYQTYWKELYNYVFVLCQSDAKTEDVLQDVFTDLWELRGRLDHVQSLKAYIFSMVRSKSLRMLYIEKRIPKEQIDLLADELLQSNWGALDNLIASDIESVIQSAIRSMPIRMQETFVKSRYEGYSGQEISDEMGVSYQTVKKQLHYSLKFIKATLSHLHIY